MAVFDGTLRNLYDAVGIDVTLSLTGDKVTVISDDGEMGTWPITSAAIRSFDSGSYEFYAEGDLLLFTPDDLVGFRTSPFVVGLPPDTEGRKRHRSKNMEAPAKPESRAVRPEPEAVKAPKKKSPVAKKTKKKLPVVKRKRSRTSRVAEKASSGPVKKPSRSERKATAETNTPTAGDEQERAPVAPEPDPAETRAVAESVEASARDLPEPDPVDADQEREPVVRAPEDREPGRPEHAAAAEPAEAPARDGREPVRVDAEPEQESVAAAPANGRMRSGVWIRALDAARRYDVFDLNRVPIDKSLRGREHQHTWDHRVATAEGVAGRVCTICGKIRLSTSRGGRSRRSKR